MPNSSACGTPANCCSAQPAIVARIATAILRGVFSAQSMGRFYDARGGRQLRGRRGTFAVYCSVWPALTRPGDENVGPAQENAP